MTLEETIQKAESIGALSSREEKEAMWNLAQKHIKKGGLAIEVGTWTGGSAVILGEVCRQKGARLICIDGFTSDMHSMGNGTNSDAFRSVLDNCKDLPIDYMAGDSQFFKRYLKKTIADFIFIDGVHTLPGVRKDIVGYYPVLRNKGCYFMHDYGNPCDVKKVVDSFFKPNQLHFVDASVYVIKYEISSI